MTFCNPSGLLWFYLAAAAFTLTMPILHSILPLSPHSSVFNSCVTHLDDIPRVIFSIGLL